MTIQNIIKQLNFLRCDRADDNNALQAAKRSLKEWNELLEECGRVAIVDREDLFNLVKKHIARIEK